MMIRPLRAIRPIRIVPALLATALAAFALVAFARAPATPQEAPDAVKSLVGTYRGEWRLFGVDNTGKVVSRATWTDVMVAQTPTVEGGRAFVKTVDEMNFTGLGGKKQWPGSEGYLLKADGSLGDYFVATGDQITRGQKIADNVWTYVADVSTAELQSLGFPAEATGSHVTVKVVATEQEHEVHRLTRVTTVRWNDAEGAVHALQFVSLQGFHRKD
jgi:hypothetical protein